jgi:hypothetical protein
MPRAEPLFSLTGAGQPITMPVSITGSLVPFRERVSLHLLATVHPAYISAKSSRAVSTTSSEFRQPVPPSAGLPRPTFLLHPARGYALFRPACCSPPCSSACALPPSATGAAADLRPATIAPVDTLPTAVRPVFIRK